MLLVFKGKKNLKMETENVRKQLKIFGKCSGV